MASTISFIQANLQHRIAARTVGVKGIDVALIQEPWYRGDCIGASTFQVIPYSL